MTSTHDANEPLSPASERSWLAVFHRLVRFFAWLVVGVESVARWCALVAAIVSVPVVIALIGWKVVEAARKDWNMVAICAAGSFAGVFGVMCLEKLCQWARRVSDSPGKKRKSDNDFYTLAVTDRQQQKRSARIVVKRK